MNECFENLVGIRTECGDQTPSDSELYIQDLSFIDLKLADAIVSDQDSGVQLLRDLYSRAVNYLINDIRVRMNPYFKQGSVLENNTVGYYAYQRNIINGSAGVYKGIQLQVRDLTYLDLFFSSLSIWVDYSGDIDIEVWNLTTGKLLDTIPVTTVAGVQQVIPTTYKKYANNGQNLNLFIGYNSTGINSYQANIYNYLIPFSYGSCVTCLNPVGWFRNRYVWILQQSIPAASDKIQGNLNSSTDTGGLSVTYSLQCSMEKWLCQMRNQYAYALMHRWGVEVLKEASMSNRLNSLVVLNKDAKQALQLDFEEIYQKSMQNSFRNIRLPNDVCFNCNKHVLTGIAMP